jgi:L-alanine-DL-glutamate epimerase-like enolase superfamily enzyme
MIITKIETFPLRIPFKPGSRSDAAAWGDKDLPAADSLLVKVTTDGGLEGWARPSVSRPPRRIDWRSTS